MVTATLCGIWPLAIPVGVATLPATPSRVGVMTRPGLGCTLGEGGAGMKDGVDDGGGGVGGGAIEPDTGVQNKTSNNTLIMGLKVRLMNNTK